MQFIACWLLILEVAVVLGYLVVLVFGRCSWWFSCDTDFVLLFTGLWPAYLFVCCLIIVLGWSVGYVGSCLCCFSSLCRTIDWLRLIFDSLLLLRLVGLRVCCLFGWFNLRRICLLLIGICKFIWL